MFISIIEKVSLIILLFGSCRSFGCLEFFNFQTREKIGSYAVSKKSVVKEDVKNAVQALYRQGVEFSIRILGEVEEIGDCAFRDCEDLKTVIFGEGSLLKRIGSNAFAYTTSLVSLEIPASLEEIGGFAFLECNNLKTVIFEEGSQLKRIEYGAFNGTSIESISIPASVERIGVYAFVDCKDLKTVTFGENSKLKRIGSHSFSHNISLTSILIPASVEGIEGYAFENCNNLQKVIFGEGSQLKRIVDYAFIGTDLSSKVTIPKSVIWIEKYAFSDCKNLKTVIFEEGSLLKRIRDYAFSNNTSLTSILIPASVEGIGEYAFAGCKNLTQVMFKKDSQLRWIGSSAFFSNTSLTSIEIPKRVERIEECTFLKCKNLKKVTFEEGSLLRCINDHAFKDTGLSGKITIPVSIRKIGKKAFRGCQQLQEVHIQEALNFKNKLDFNAFKRCPNLHIIYPISCCMILEKPCKVFNVIRTINKRNTPLVEIKECMSLEERKKHKELWYFFFLRKENMLNKIMFDTEYRLEGEGSIKKEDLRAVVSELTKYKEKLLPMIKNDSMLFVDPILMVNPKSFLLYFNKLCNNFINNPTEDAFITMINLAKLRDNGGLPEQYAANILARIIIDFPFYDIYDAAQKAFKIDFMNVNNISHLLYSQDENAIMALKFYKILGRIFYYYRSILGEQLPQNSVELAIVKDDRESLQELITSDPTCSLYASCINLSDQNHNRLRKSLRDQFSYSKWMQIQLGQVNLLQYAALFGSLECFKYLCLNTSNIENILKDLLTMQCAIIGGNTEIIRTLEQKGASMSTDMVPVALSAGHTDVAQWIEELLDNSSGNPQ